MIKKYKMAVGNVVRVSVEGTCSNEDGQKTKFKFSLRCTRLSATDLAAALASRDDLAKDFLISVTTDWKEQRLVLEEDGSPAEFCTEAFEALLDIAGMPLVCLNAYVKEVGATAKN